MVDSPSIEHALDSFQDAALGLTGWEDALQSLTEALGARSCVLIPLDQDLSVRRRLQLESRSHARFTSIWMDNIDGAPDPHTTRPGLMNVEQQPTLIEHQITTDTERSEMAYYRSIATEGNRAWWASVRFRTRARAWALPLYRTEKQGPYTLEDARRLDRIMPAIRRTVAFVEAVTETKVSERLNTLGDLGCPCFVLNDDGAVLQTNHAADQVLGSDLWIRRGRLVSDDGHALAVLSALCRQSPGSDAAKRSSALLTRDGMPWLLAQITDLSPLARDVFCGGRKLLFLRPVVSKDLVDPEFLTTVFGLTPTEARFASALTHGPGLDAGCAALGLGRETGRTHLRAIFRKTNTGSQAELAALLSKVMPTELT